eukprot:GHVS01104962.1.p1 GENE.GHVS01104962.1~~GHVS01104962.1.p1  ORF type:complete len:466 (-),score=83.87 GHVS01104962.1:396-1706(-)
MFSQYIKRTCVVPPFSLRLVRHCPVAILSGIRAASTASVVYTTTTAGGRGRLYSSTSMEEQICSPLISTTQLAEAIFHSSSSPPSTVAPGQVGRSLMSSKNLCLLDCSWLGLPMFNERDPISEFRSVRIPGSCFLSLQAMSDSSSPYPHTMPSSDHIDACLAQLLGTPSRCTQFVLYDSVGVWSAPRVWWMLRSAGYNRVRVLDGGLPKWMAESRPVEKDKVDDSRLLQPEQQLVNGKSGGGHSAKGEPLQFISSYDDVNRAVSRYGDGADKDQPSVVVLDVRPAARFKGDDTEPRPGLPSGSIPHSKNVPFSTLLKTVANTNGGSTHGELAADGDVLKYTLMKDKEELQQLFRAVDVLDNNGNIKKEVIFSCGSGVTAAIGFLALHCCGVDMQEIKLYDGSWAEWKNKKMAEEEQKVMMSAAAPKHNENSRICAQ